MAGPIQSSINNMLGMGATVATLSGAVAERREEQKFDDLLSTARSEQKRLDKITSGKDKKATEIDRKVAEESVQRIDEQLNERAKKLFEMNPSSDNLQRLEMRRKGQLENESVLRNRKMDEADANAEAEAQQALEDEMLQREVANETGYVPNDEARAEQANERATTQQATRKKRRNFMRDYLSQMQTNMGGKVGDMAPDLQKKIAANYSSKERQRIMNQQDKEKGGKK